MQPNESFKNWWLPYHGYRQHYPNSSPVRGHRLYPPLMTVVVLLLEREAAVDDCDVQVALGPPPQALRSFILFIVCVSAVTDYLVVVVVLQVAELTY